MVKGFGGESERVPVMEVTRSRSSCTHQVRSYLIRVNIYLFLVKKRMFVLCKNLEHSKNFVV